MNAALRVFHAPAATPTACVRQTPSKRTIPPYDLMTATATAADMPGSPAVRACSRRPGGLEGRSVHHHRPHIYQLMPVISLVAVVLFIARGPVLLAIPASFALFAAHCYFLVGSFVPARPVGVWLPRWQMAWI